MELDFNLVSLLIITFSCLVLSYHFLIVLPLRKEISNKKDEQLEVLDEIERRNFAHPLSSPAVPVDPVDPVDVVNAIKVKAAPDNKKDEKKKKEETLKMNSDTISTKQQQQQQQHERVNNEKSNNIENNNKDSNKTKVSKKKVQSTIVKHRDTPEKKNFYYDCNNIKWKATNEHPGLEAFHVWHEEISNIYRIYKTNNNNNNNDEYGLYPSLSSSERGFVSLQLEVFNNCRKRNISVYWVDFKGKEHHKGDIPANGGFFHQTTWIGHPWIFRDSNNNNEEKKIVLSFTPFRIIPTTRSIPTTTTNNERMGIHKFSILDSPQNEESTDNSIVSIHDPVFVHPSSQISTVDAALEFSILQMERSASPIASIDLIMRYLKNIILHNPTSTKKGGNNNNNNNKKEVKNVRRIRIANKVFRDNVWLCNDLCNRGIFFALGFVENGSFLEIGNNTNNNEDEKVSHQVLPQDRKRDISTAIFLLEKLKKNLLMYAPLQQPQGVDGGVIGRAGWRI